MNNQWVEAVGLPGVGKSTIMNKHYDFLEKRYKIIESRRHNKLNSLYTVIISHFIGAGLPDKVLAKKLAYRLSFRWHRQRHKNLLFFDSGLAQVVLENLIESNFKDEDIKLDWLKNSLLSDTVLYFYDESDAILTRETNRTDKRFPDIPEALIKNRYRQAETVIEQKIIPMFNQVIRINPLKDDLTEALKL